MCGLFADPSRLCWLFASDRLRQRRQPSAGALDAEIRRICNSHCARCEPNADGSPTAHGKHSTGGLGCVLGLLLTWLGTKTVIGLLPGALPRANEVGLYVRVVLFTLGVSLAAGIVLASLQPSRHPASICRRSSERAEAVQAEHGTPARPLRLRRSGDGSGAVGRRRTNGTHADSVLARESRL